MFGGNLSAFGFSVVGGVFSLLAMTAVKDFKNISIIGVSIIGSAFHVTGQIVAAYFMLGSFYVFAYLPILLFTSIFTGVLTGSVTGALFKAVLRSGALDIYFKAIDR